VYFVKWVIDLCLEDGGNRVIRNFVPIYKTTRRPIPDASNLVACLCLVALFLHILLILRIACSNFIIRHYQRFEKETLFQCSNLKKIGAEFSQLILNG
jgi:hypothetical protein